MTGGWFERSANFAEPGSRLGQIGERFLEKTGFKSFTIYNTHDGPDEGARVNGR